MGRIKSTCLFISLLFTLYSLLISSCVKEEKAKSEINIVKSVPQQILKNFTAFESKAGKKLWSLAAAQAEIFEGRKNEGGREKLKKTILIENFTIKFYSENGKSIDGVLKASNGEMNTDKKEFKTIGKTILTTSDEKLICSNLYYNPETKKIYSESDVKLIRKDAIVTGKGLEATPDLSSVIIKENLVEIKK